MARPGVYLFTHIATQRHYVGMSWNVRKRIGGHARGESPRKFKAAINKYGRKAFLVVGLYYSLSVETDMLPQIEVDMIQAYASWGATGFNVMLGKGSVGPYSAEYAELVSVRFRALYGDEAWATQRKARLREDALARWADPEMRAMMLERSKNGTDRPETRAKLSASSTRMWKNPEKRQQIVASMKATLATPEAKARKSTPELVAHLKRISAAAWSDPDVVARHAAAQKIAANKPERIAAFSRAATEAWADPERRARQVASRIKRWEDTQARDAMSAKMKANDMRWINDGMILSRIKGCDPLPEGWAYGKGATATKGLVWINDRTKNRRIPKTDPIPDGWAAGVTTKGKPRSRKK